MPIIWNKRTGIITKVSVLPRIVIAVLYDRGEIYFIIFNICHLWFIGYHIVDYFHVSPLNLDFNTSWKICPIIFLFVEASITYTLIRHIFPKTLWFSTYFTLIILCVVDVGSYWKRYKIGVTCLLDEWNQRVTTWYQYKSFLFLLTAVCFDEFKIKNINLGRTTPHRLYPHITPQTHKQIIIEVHLISNMYTARSWSFTIFWLQIWWFSQHEMLDGWIILSLGAIHHVIT